MNWYEVLIALGGFGIIQMIVTPLLSIYNAKTDKKTKDIQSLNNTIDQLQDQVAKQGEIIKILQDKVDKLSSKLDIKSRAINLAFSCNKRIECPVIQYIESKEK